jgi:hypothetical protein
MIEAISAAKEKAAAWGDLVKFLPRQLSRQEFD